MPDADLSLADPLAYLEHANRETFVVVQIEDAEALGALDDIAAVKGIDVLFVGLADLSVSLGVPMQTTHPTVQDAVRRIGEAAQRHGKWWGHPVPTPAAAKASAARGGRFFSCKGDFGFLRDGLRELRADFDRELGDYL